VLVSFLALILGGGVLKLPTLTFFFIVSAFIIKIVAGGKRRAESTATEATKRAEEEQLQRTVLEARMEALQAQIEPHFLFNTLASIDQLILTDPPRASRMQQSLIRYLRSSMPQIRDGRRPTLGQQVDLSAAYLEIMAVRMEGRLQPVVNVTEGLKSAVFPSMMLQTLVENAIKHGLSRSPTAASSRSPPKLPTASSPSMCATPEWASCRSPSPGSGSPTSASASPRCTAGAPS
jgi:LytS/YehU family sensor histidine kinase